MKTTARRNGAASRTGFIELEQLPNVGPAVARDLRRLKINRPADLVGRDPYVMYDDLCRVTGKRHDPCMLDTFIAVVRFMGGAPVKPWWAYTAERKRRMNSTSSVTGNTASAAGRDGGQAGRTRHRGGSST